MNDRMLPRDEELRMLWREIISQNCESRFILRSLSNKYLVSKVSKQLSLKSTELWLLHNMIHYLEY